jgi:hypothetical protein
MGEARYALEEAVASMGDASVSDETVSVDLPGRFDLPASADDLRFLIYAGMADLFADLSLEAADSDIKRVDVLVRFLRALVSAEPVLKFARYDRSSNTEALERVARMRGKDIGATESWLIPRLQADIAAYRARIDALRMALGERSG